MVIMTEPIWNFPQTFSECLSLDLHQTLFITWKHKSIKPIKKRLIWSNGYKHFHQSFDVSKYTNTLLFKLQKERTASASFPKYIPPSRTCHIWICCLCYWETFSVSPPPKRPMLLKLRHTRAHTPPHTHTQTHTHTPPPLFLSEANVQSSQWTEWMTKSSIFRVVQVSVKIRNQTSISLAKVTKPFLRLWDSKISPRQLIQEVIK